MVQNASQNRKKQAGKQQAVQTSPANISSYSSSVVSTNGFFSTCRKAPVIRKGNLVEEVSVTLVEVDSLILTIISIPKRAEISFSFDSISITFQIESEY